VLEAKATGSARFCLAPFCYQIAAVREFRGLRLTGFRLSTFEQPNQFVLDELRRVLRSAAFVGQLIFDLLPAPATRQRRPKPLPIPSTISQAELEPIEDDFIEIELVDEADKPIGGVAYLVELPHGGKHSGKLNGDGFVRIEGILSGNCRVTFPELDAASWEPV
jgi:hypothetical protein